MIATQQTTPVSFSEPSLPVKQEEAPRVRRWTRQSYHHAAEVGFFGAEEHLELLDGEVLEKMSPQSRPHAWSVGRAAQLLRRLFGEEYYVREEKPFVVSEASELEPDIVVVRGQMEASIDHPTSASSVLVMEVSESSLAFDQRQKAAAYAQAGVEDYWLLNLRHRRLEVRREPDNIVGEGWGYKSVRLLLPGEAIAPLAAPDQTIAVTDLLPPLSEAETSA